MYTVKKLNLMDNENDLNSFTVDIQQYEPKKVIGEGGYAQVILAVNKVSGEYVALKRFTANITKKVTKSYVK